MKKILITGCTVILLATGAYAGGDMGKIAEVEPYVDVNVPMETKQFYAGLGVSVERVNSYIFPKETVTGVTGRVGYDFSKYLGVEFRGTIGVSDGDKLGHDYSYGLYLKPQYPVSKEVSIYALAGYAQSKISFDNEVAFNGIRNNYTTQNGFSFGAGLEYRLNESWSLFVDATRLIDKSTTQVEGKYAIKVDGLTFGFVYRF
jgi:opacity protein-like surface antigen